MKRLIISLLLALIILVPLAGCSSSKVNTEREAILAFTRSALQIEAQRAELMKYFATARTEFGRFAQRTIIERSFYPGVRPNAYKYVPPLGLEGMGSLQGKLSLLVCPPSLQPASLW